MGGQAGEIKAAWQGLAQIKVQGAPVRAKASLAAVDSHQDHGVGVEAQFHLVGAGAQIDREVEAGTVLGIGHRAALADRQGA